ncbi:MAG: PAS domain S-box protein [Desulfomonilaceae bacterium]|nr:PAS domain S-box protein [Desulfomonilaceae bacterium]
MLQTSTPRVELIGTSVENFLESHSDPAALVLPDGRVAATNSRMRTVLGTVGEGLCYEVLAGLDKICPFCPFEKLVSGGAGAVLDQRAVRHGQACRVNLRFFREIGESGAILETVRYFSDEETNPDLRQESRDMMPRLLTKLSGLLSISRDLMAAGAFHERIANVLQHMRDSLSDPSNAVGWLELGSEVYGSPSKEVKGALSVHDIQAEGEIRGRLVVNFTASDRIFPEDEYFLQETADLIGRQLAVSDLEAMLRRSEERYRRLASNLQQEMWSRTEALAKETGHLEGILRSSDDMIITTDLESRIVEFNPAAVETLGYSSEEIQGRPVSVLWEDAAEREHIMEEVRRTGGVRNYKTRLRAKSGEVREISLTLSLLKDPEGRVLGTVGVSKDVSRDNAIRRELELLNRNYRETIHFISHETKNSLIVIAGFVRRLLKSETDPSRTEKLEIVYHHAKFLEAMSRDFLVMAELEHGEFQIRKEMIEDFYKDVILPAMIGLKERYPDSFQSYDESMGGVGGVRLMGNRGLLEIVYRNLFGNALKYRYEGGKIAYGVLDRGDRYLFNVWNAGPGVKSDQVEKIFLKFYRVLDETTRDKRGTGLGLYNIRRIVEGHGGRIWCESKPGEWVNFLFELPKE